MDQQVYVQDGNIVVNVEYEYDIEISSCSSYARILGWVQQLLTKNWITPAILEEFIQIALREANLEEPA